MTTTTSDATPDRQVLPQHLPANGLPSTWDFGEGFEHGPSSDRGKCWVLGPVVVLRTESEAQRPAASRAQVMSSMSAAERNSSRVSPLNRYQAGIGS